MSYIGFCVGNSFVYCDSYFLNNWLHAVIFSFVHYHRTEYKSDLTYCEWNSSFAIRCTSCISLLFSPCTFNCKIFPQLISTLICINVYNLIRTLLIDLHQHDRVCFPAFLSRVQKKKEGSGETCWRWYEIST